MQLDQLTFRQLLDGIAAKTPTPGGGAVASLTAALAAALGQMVLNYSIGKKSLSTHEASNAVALKELNDAVTQALQLAHDDAAAYARLNELWKLDKDDRRRKTDFATAVNNAIKPPREVLQLSLVMLRLMRTLTGTTNQMLRSDLAIAAVLAEAAARSAAWNVRINLPLIEDSQTADALSSEMQDAVNEAHLLASAIEMACR